MDEKACLEILDAYMKKKTQEAAVAYVKYISEMRDLTERMAYAYIFGVITIHEIERYGKAVFLMQQDSVEALKRMLCQIRFCLWEVEFSCGADANERLFAVLSENHITAVAMHDIITIAGMHKSACIQWVSDIWMEHQEMEKGLELQGYLV